MPKQLRLKFKKILKQAEFVHADLEYHEQLVPEAKQLFFDAIAKIVKSLPDEQRARIEEVNKKRYEREMENFQVPVEPGGRGEENSCKAVVPTNLEVEDTSGDEGGATESSHKTHELKKLFRQIAELTHPDKVETQEFSRAECVRRIQIFKEARRAYEENNWYILYSVATNLGLDPGEPSTEKIEWVEDDIRSTLHTIARIGSLVVWVWYVGSEKAKRVALENYFQQTYGFAPDNL